MAPASTSSARLFSARLDCVRCGGVEKSQRSVQDVRLCDLCSVCSGSEPALRRQLVDQRAQPARSNRACPVPFFGWGSRLYSQRSRTSYVFGLFSATLGAAVQADFRPPQPARSSRIECLLSNAPEPAGAQCRHSRTHGSVRCGNLCSLKWACSLRSELFSSSRMHGSELEFLGQPAPRTRPWRSA
jgi:hypothetical protein